MEHKKGKLKNDPDYSPVLEYFWELNSSPKRLDVDDKIYFATNGYIRGYFDILQLDFNRITFDSRTWKDIDPIKTKSFQGFKYADKVERLEK